MFPQVRLAVSSRAACSASFLLRILLVLTLVLPVILPVSPARAASRVPVAAVRAAGVIVRFRESVAKDASAASAAEGLPVAAVLDSGTGVVRVAIRPGTDAGAYARELARRTDVAWAEPDLPILPSSLASPTDPDYLDSRTYTSGGGTYLFAPSWWVRKVAAPAAWAAGYGTATPLRAPAESFRVAVIDSGCWLDHPDIGDNVLPGYDLFQTYRASTGAYTTDSDVTPVTPGVGGSTNNESSHGTAVAAIVAGTVNGVGMVGVGGDVQVIPYKVHGIWIDGGSYGYEDGEAMMLTSAVVAAIYRATNDGCRVINMSLGSYSPSVSQQSAVDYARSKGVLVVAAMGNDASTAPHYPAACTGVIGVTATGLDASGVEVLASYSNRGPAADIAAPGNMHWLPITPGYDADGSGSFCRPGYSFWQGTSMASPVVAGTAAFLWRAQPSLTLAQMESLLRDTAVDLGAVGRDDLFGSGRVDVGAGYARLVQDYPPLPAVASLTLPAYSPLASVAASWPAVAGCTNYEVSLDFCVPTTTTAVSSSFSPLSDGPHIVAVRPTSSSQWPGAWVSRTVTVDTVAPSVTKPALADSTLTWTGSGTGTPCTYEVSLDGTTVASGLAAASWPVTGVATGSTHSYGIRATDAAGNRSGWVTAELVFVAPKVVVVPLRFAGSDRFATAILASQSAYGTGSCSSVIIATGLNYPDALAAAGLGGAADAPVLLVGGDVLRADVKAEIKRLVQGQSTYKVYILGSAAAVTAKMEASIKASLTGESVERFSGKDRYATAQLVALKVKALQGASFGHTAILVPSLDYVDGLLVGPAAFSAKAPILLVNTTADAGLKATLKTLGTTDLVICGTNARIPTSVETVLESAVPGLVTRRASNLTDTYARSAAAAEYFANPANGFGLTWDGLSIATAEKFPDGLSAGCVEGKFGTGLLLTKSTSLPSAIATKIAAHEATVGTVRLYGSTAAVSTAVETSVRNLLQ